MAIRIHETGGPEVLRWEEVEIGDPGRGEIRLRHSAVGLNYIDTYHRSGLYPLGLPCGIGLEAAGVVEAVDEGVAELAPGNRVAYASPPPGAYATERLMPADRVVKLPDGIGDEQAAAMMLKGMTAEYLLRRTYAVKTGETILFHAVAGGVGLIACQWAKHIGASVISTVGSDEKAEAAKVHGCDYPIVDTRENFVERVREITGGKGVPVVYDSVGKDTFMGSLDCLSPRGLFVNFGSASGSPPPLDTGILSAKGSLYVTRPTLMTYTASHAELVESATGLFEAVSSGAIRIEVNQRCPLVEAAQAQRELGARRTTGSTILYC